MHERHVQLPRGHEVQPDLQPHRRSLPDHVREQQRVRAQLHGRQLPDHVRGRCNVQRQLPGRELPHVVRRRFDLRRELPRRELHAEMHGREVLLCIVRGRYLQLLRNGMPVKRAAPLLLALSLFSGAAAAQHEKALAKEAYDCGTQAHDRGDFRRAAEEYARADALAPSPVALQAALDAAVDADDPAIGAELLERAKRAPAKGALAASIEAAKKKLGGRAGRVHVACPSGAQCTSTVDGAAIDGAKGAWLKVGAHALVVNVDGTPDSRTVDIRAGQDVEIVPIRTAAALPAPSASAPVASVPVAPSAPPPPSTPPPEAAAPAPAPPPPEHARDDTAHKPLPPIVFFVGAGLTVVLGGASTYFAVAAKGKHDDFTTAGCDRADNGTSCSGLKSDGEGAQRNANIGFAATGVAAVATVVIGAFFTDWDRAARAGHAPVVVPVAGGAGLSYGARF